MAEIFQCGKTQISTILKGKDKIVRMYENNASAELRHTRKRVCESKYSDVNEALYPWYLLAISKNIYPDERYLTEKVVEIAQKLGVAECLKASNDWFD